MLAREYDIQGKSEKEPHSTAPTSLSPSLPNQSINPSLSGQDPTILTLAGRGGEQNLMKGYISRERGIVVLSKTGAFPGTGI